MISPAEILGPKGRIAARLANYEHRGEQLAMADAVADAIQRQHHLVVEAGTGVGKSFAYLVPAILATAQKAKEWKDKGDKEVPPPRVIISTHTISLQEQLLTKDIPLLRSVMPVEFTAVLAKGRRNYISLRRLKNALSRAVALFSEEDDYEQLRQINAWSKETNDGSLADLSFKPSPVVWEEVASDHANCMGRKCPHNADCFYYAARRRMSRAQIVVVNHALYFTDLALRMEGAAMLPRHDIVIFDEAHTLEAVAGDHLGLRLTNGQVEFTLRRLFNDRANKGLLVRPGGGEAQRQVLDCYHRAEQFFDDVGRWLAKQSGGNGRVRQPLVVENRLSEGLGKLSRLVRELGKKIDKDEERQDFTAAAARLDGMAKGLEDWNTQKIAEAVYWVESVKGRRATDFAGRHAGRYRADPSRASLWQGAHGHHHQRHAGHRREVRFFPGPRRADANRLAQPRQPVQLPGAGRAGSAGRHARSGRRGVALRAGSGGNDSPLRGADRRPGVRALHQL